MPTQVSYPGVYIEEITSGVRTITEVATSITAFVGWAPKGPIDRAVRVLNFPEYEKHFGPIHPNSYLGYSVKQYFENGGSDAYVLRLVKQKADGTIDTATEVQGTTTVSGIKFKASSPGDWSKHYGITIKPSADNKRFSISVIKFAIGTDGKPLTETDKNPPTTLETFTRLSADVNDPRYFCDVINAYETGSMLVTVEKPTSAVTVQNGTSAPFSDGKATVLSEPDDINQGTWTTALSNVVAEDKQLDQIDLFNLLCVPGLTDATTLAVLSSFCERRRAFLIADSLRTVADPNTYNPPSVSTRKNSAVYFPWLNAPDPLSEGRLSDFPPCGFLAGLFARTDASRGVWKAPAGTEATLVGVHSPTIVLTDKQNGLLNPKGVNCIRNFPVYGNISWGARTLDGNDEIGSEWKYIPVRRTALFIEETLFRATKWAVFEPNDEPLWAQLRLNIGSFMNDLFRQGAFQGRSPREAYFVKCDKETTTQSDINRGIVNVVVGFAPLKPAEFVVIKLTQIAGQIEV
jgi:phage tail sheath protein FI